jgi:hypothetical protein
LATKEEAKAAVEQAYAKFVASHPNARDHWQKHMAELEARMAAWSRRGQRRERTGA